MDEPVFFLSQYWDKPHLVLYMSENQNIVNGSKQSMNEVINLEIDEYVMKKCLKQYENKMKKLGISMTSFTDLTQ